MRESTFEAKFGKMVKKLGGLSYKWVSPGNAGVPDRIVFFPPSTRIGETLVEGIWFVELKSTKGRLTPRQRHQHDRLRQRGARVLTLWPDTHQYVPVSLQFLKAVCLCKARMWLKVNTATTPRTKLLYADMCTSIEEVETDANN
ncbi:VRR-NUC domain-containing protein [Thiolapillus sp.]|uniref:VRR-NUC domain-containing protein n=1 Tax=Thiolapillus sp. TaxID=2017437 RepID=UPI003AF6C34D